MTDKEEKILEQICVLLCDCGRGLEESELIQIMSDIKNRNVDKCNHTKILYHCMQDFLKRNGVHSRVNDTSSLDPKRAKQADEETRDSIFAKLHNYIRLLHEMRLLKETSYSQIQPHRIYNMDEVGLDTTRRRAKLIANAATVNRIFQITPEGDGRMNTHVTIAVTSRADGKCNKLLIEHFV